MANTKKTKNDQFDLSIFPSHLNFAFCPASLLSVSEKLYQNNKPFQKLIKEFPHQEKELVSALRYFYVCYSLKVENIENEKKDYFYFQVYSKIAGYIYPEQPIYGFFDEEKIVSMIQEINEMFLPQNHDKIILDSYVYDIYSDTNSIITGLQKWTEAKLVDFGALYFSDEDVLFSISKIIDKQKKAENTRKSTKLKKNNVKTNQENEKRKRTNAGRTPR